MENNPNQGQKGNDKMGHGHQGHDKQGQGQKGQDKYGQGQKPGFDQKNNPDQGDKR